MSKELLVVKYGSSCVSGREGIDQTRIDGYAGQLAEASSVYDIVVVSSGSIAVGETMWQQNEAEAAEFLGDDYETAELPSEQVLASLGSAPAVVAWQNALRGRRGPAGRRIMAGQIQVTHHEVRDKKEGGMLAKTMQECLAGNIVSVVNENDALSDEEIKELRYGGDNDGLARYIAARLKAQKLCLLIDDEEGLLDKEGQVVSIVKSRTSDWAQTLVQKSPQGKRSKGGMKSKVQASISAAASGIRTHIASADRPILDVLDRKYGTYFAPH